MVVVMVLYFSRLTLGLTQEQAGLALGEYCGTFFSQTTISRFESLNLSYRNMVKLATIFSGWLQVASLHSMLWLFQLFGPDYDSQEKEETNRKHLQELNVVNFPMNSFVSSTGTGCFSVTSNSQYTKQKWISEIIKYGKLGELLTLHLLSRRIKTNIFYKKILKI